MNFLNVHQQLDAWNRFEHQPDFINCINEKLQSSDQITVYNFASSRSAQQIESAYNKINDFIERNKGSFDASDVERLEKLAKRITSVGICPDMRHKVLGKIYNIVVNINEKCPNLPTDINNPRETKVFFQSVRSFIKDGRVPEAENYTRAYCKLARNSPNSEDNLSAFFEIISDYSRNEQLKDRYHTILKTMLETAPPTEDEEGYKQSVIDTYLDDEIATPELRAIIENYIDIIMM